MHNSVDSGSLQRRIPSTRLEQSTRSFTGQLPVRQSQQQQETQKSEHLRQQHSNTHSLWQLERNASNKSEQEKHCDLQNRVSALAAVAQATNSRLAEVHIVGEVAAGHGFNVGCGLFCELKFIAGSEWTPLCREAVEPQQTQTAYGNPADLYVWSHPVDLHYTLCSVVGWPSCTLCVWKLDSNGRASPLAFGSTCLPMAVGEHEVVCHTWSPVGPAGEELAGRMFGRQEALGQPAWPSTGDPEKTQLVTRTSGRVLLRLSVATRYFREHGISTGPAGASPCAAAAAQDSGFSQQLMECKQIFAAYLKAAERDDQGPPVG